MRIKIITAKSDLELERDVNEFLSKVGLIRVHSIQYTQKDIGVSAMIWYSVLE